MADLIRKGTLFLIRFITRMRFLPFGLRFRLARIWFEPTINNNDQFCVDFYTFKYPGRLSNYIDWSVFFFGAYEQKDLDTCIRLIKKLKLDRQSCTVYDVGANIGHHALAFAVNADLVYAFEPFEPVRNQIEDKVKLNAINNIVIYPVGLSSESTDLTFVPPDPNNLGTGFFNPSGINLDTEPGVLKLKVVEGDSWVQSNKLKLPDFIKIDVEGFEPYTLIGLKSTLNVSQPILMVELSEKCLEHLKLLNVTSFFELLPPNYEAYTVERGKLQKTSLSFQGKNFFFIPNHLSIN